MSDFEIILCCLLIPFTYALVYATGRYNLIGKLTDETVDKDVVRYDYDRMYSELWELLQDLREWYSIDKVRSGRVYVWTKGEDSEDAFDILADEIVMHDENHVIPFEAMSVILEIQEKLDEINKYLED